METDLEEGTESRVKWQRVGLIVVFALVYQISEIVFAAITLFQVFSLLISGSRNESLNDFSVRLTQYMYLVLQFVCLQSSTVPWPLDASESETNKY